MSEVLVLQHVGCETLGTIGDALLAQGAAIRYVRSYEGEVVPSELGDAGGLVVMGGPMSVYDHPTHPFLKQEMLLVEQALRLGKPVLGVCLGSQLLAAVLGAPVVPGRQKEIGWYPVTLTGAAAVDPLWRGQRSTFVAYHWHGDVFALPSGAVSLACSELTEHQAFRYGSKAYGMLFHMEVTTEMIGSMVGAFAAELRDAGIDGGDVVGQAGTHLAALQEIGRTVFERWSSLVGTQSDGYGSSTPTFS